MNHESEIKRQTAGIVLSFLLFAAALLPAGGCPSKTPQNRDQKSEVRSQTSGRTPAAVALFGYRVIKEYPHDPCAFTQGLVYENGLLYEGTGLYGRSKLIKRDFKTWSVVQQIELPAQYFGEGIALVGDRLVQLTWQEHVGFVYDKNTFARIGQFTVATEGWGLTFDGTRLILSDGSNTLSFLDPNTFASIGQVRVTDRGRPIREINELEYISDPAFLGSLQRSALPSNLQPPTPVVLANILGANVIAIIAPQTGDITGWINLAGLYTPPAGRPGQLRPQRHRVPPRKPAPPRHRQVLAEDVRDRTGPPEPTIARRT